MPRRASSLPARPLHRPHRIARRITGGSLAAVLALGTLALAGPAGADDADGADSDAPIAVEPPVGHDHGGPEMMQRQMRTATAPQTAYQMPFPCGQAWAGATRSSHSPSPLSIDWNRTDDLGDPVVASADGKVIVADAVDNGGYGKWIQVSHTTRESTLYAHLNALNVKTNQQVRRGDVIGYVGTTGNSSGPHLHFEERDGSSVRTPFFDGAAFKFGTTLTSKNCADPDPEPEPTAVTDPFAGNMTGDAVAEAGYYERGEVHRFRIIGADGTETSRKMGAVGDLPVIGDWDGNGVDNVGLRTPSTSTFTLKIGQRTEQVQWGVSRDLPIAGDWNGDGKAEVGLRKTNKPKFRLRAPDGTVRAVYVGKAGDLPVTGDWNGDGITDVGVYDSAARTFTLRTITATTAGDQAKDIVVRFGNPGYLPVTGDWDGNGVTDLGVWNPATAMLRKRLATAPGDAQSTIERVKVGRPRS